MFKLIKILLGIHIHSWGNWEVFEEGSILHNKTNNVLGTYMHQKRVCKSCGYTEIRTQRSDRC